MRKPNHTNHTRTSSSARRKAGWYLSGALIAAGAAVPNATAQSNAAQENQDLKKRLEALENIMKKEGIMPSGGGKTVPVTALSETTISGFVQASYFYDTGKPADGVSNGYLWNSTHNSFSINKVKLTIASPGVEKDKWDAAYRVSMMWGEDSVVLNTGSPGAGFEALREAYVELNVPIGSGLSVKAGQLISLLNYESGDGGAANANFSQGYQWFYTGNGPSAGVQLGYAFSDAVDLKVRVQNGMYAGPVDNNNDKTLMAALGIKPSKNSWISLIGFGGNENAAFSVIGGSVLAGWNPTEALGLGLEFDYFSFDFDPAPTADLWSIGAWATYDFSSKVGLALRGEYLDDKDGGGIRGIALGGRAGSAIVGPGTDGNLASVTLTLNFKPVPNVKIQPEIRYDHTSYNNGFDGNKDRIIVGAGVSYLF